MLVEMWKCGDEVGRRNVVLMCGICGVMLGLGLGLGLV